MDTFEWDMDVMDIHVGSVVGDGIAALQGREPPPPPQSAQPGLPIAYWLGQGDQTMPEGGEDDDTGKPDTPRGPIDNRDDNPNDWVAQFEGPRVMPPVVVDGERPGEDPGPAPNPYGPGGLPPDAPPVDLGEDTLDPGGPDEGGNCSGPDAPFDGPMPEGVDLNALRSAALNAGNLLDQLRDADGAEHGMFLLQGPAGVLASEPFTSGNSDSIEAVDINAAFESLETFFNAGYKIVGWIHV